MEKITSITRQRVAFCAFMILNLLLTFSGKGQVYESTHLTENPNANVSSVVIDTNAIDASTERTANIVATANNNCTAPTLLTVGSSCVSVSNAGNSFFGPQPSCYTGQSANQWFIFKATASNNFVRLTGKLGKCFSGLAIYGPYVSSTPGCPTSAQQIFCSKPSLSINDVTSLSFTVGDYYLIQVSDVFGGPCGSAGGSWCIAVLNPVSCTACSTPCGGIATYNSTTVPASWAVENPKYGLRPVVPASTNSPTYCYTCKANNSTITVNMGSYSEGGTGFNSFNWTLYSQSCVAIASGNLTNLTATGVQCDTSYVLCISFNPGGQIDSISPYLYAATSTCTVLPVKLTDFKATYNTDDNTVLLQWATATETNNKLFTIERSVDGINWQSIIYQSGAGTSSQPHYYNDVDEAPLSGKSYYRLKQTDYDGHYEYTAIVSLNIPTNYSVTIFPNPTNSNLTLRYSTQSQDPVNVVITDLSGKVITSYSINEVEQGINNFTVPTSSLAQGMYIMKVSNAQKTFFLKFVKE